jgi:hypothetical protein
MRQERAILWGGPRQGAPSATRRLMRLLLGAVPFLAVAACRPVDLADRRCWPSFLRGNFSMLCQSRKFWRLCVQSLLTRRSVALGRQGKRQPVDERWSAAEVLECKALLTVTAVNITSPQSALGSRAQVAAGGSFEINYTAATNLTAPTNGINLLSTHLTATINSAGNPTVAAKSWGAGVTLSASDRISATVPQSAATGTYSLTVAVTQTWSTATSGVTVSSTNFQGRPNVVVVTAAAVTTTTTVDSPAAADYGANATFNATISGSPSVGTVQFYVGSISPANAIGAAVNVTSGEASLTINPLLAVGSYTLLAEYSGGAGFLASSGSSTANAFAITKATLTVTPTAGQSKVYGASDPTFTYGVSGLVNGDTVATAITGGTLARAAGETVAGGPYNYSIGSLTSGNYSLSLGGTPAFAITPAPLTITPTAGQSKVYGASDPTFTYGVSGLVNGDTAATAITGGTLGRAVGETVAGGPYDYSIGSLTSSNYALSLEGTPSFAITPAPLTITPTAGQSKVYGASEPTFTYGVSGLVNGDTAATAITGGTLGRAAGETVAGGPYNYSIGSLTSSNYALSLEGTPSFAITPAPLTITPTAGQSKVYGASDPTFTYGVSGLVNGDTPATAITGGTLGRVAGEAVATGPYSYSFGSLSSSNYTLALDAASFEITPATVVGFFTAADKNFDGNTAATITGRSLTGVLGLDDVNFSGGTAVFDSPHVGVARMVTLTGAVLTGADASNYTLLPATSWTTTASISAVAVNFPERSSGIVSTLDTSILPFAGPYLFQVTGGADSGFFSVNASGQLSLNSPLDFEVPTDADADGRYLVDVLVTSAADPVGATFPIELTITDVNDPILISSPLTQPGAMPRVWTEKTPALAFDTDLSLTDQDANSMVGGRVWMQIQNYVLADRVTLTLDQTQNVYRIRTASGTDEVYIRDGANVILLGTTQTTGRFEMNYVEVALSNSPEVTLGRVQTFLRSVAFENLSGGPAYDRQIQLALKVYDSLGVRNSTYYSPLSIVAVPDSPVISSTLTTPLTYKENAAAVAVDSSLSLSDPDQPSSWNGYLITASLANKQDGDVLTCLGVGNDYTASDGKLFDKTSGVQVGTWQTLDGGATLQIAMTGGTSFRILRTIGFFNTSENPSMVQRVINLTVSDGISPPASMTRWLNVAPVNDASDLGGLATVDYVVGDKDGELIAAAGLITDADSADFDSGSLTAAITINRQTGDTISLLTLSSDTLSQGLFIDPVARKVFWNGTEFSTYSGGTGNTPFTLNFKGTAATAVSVTALLRRLVFKAAETNSSTLDRTITLTIKDGDGGVRTATVLMDFRLA